MSLIERLQNTTDATSWPGKIPMQYVYTAGRAGEHFFQSLKTKGKFVGAKCEKCDQVYVPARIFCESCFARLGPKDYVTLPSTGVVQSFTYSFETFDEREKKPSLVATIALDGADTVIMHWLGEVEPEDCYIGMPVEAVFKPRNQRQGSILDVKHFRPTQR